jgi:cell division transport system ATP-binding protein
MIQLYHVSKRYGQVEILKDISLHVNKGELVFITGPSGAGKTTLLNLIFCSISTDRGQIVVNGRNVLKLKDSHIPYYRREIGMIFQDFKLLQNKTVFQNVAYAQHVLGLGGKETRQKVWRMLKDVGLSHKKDNFPKELSGGEQQRVGIARALINDPSIILADEPTGNLDYEFSLEILQLFLKAQQNGATVIFATHNREIIKSIDARVIILNKGEIKGD